MAIDRIFEPDRRKVAWLNASVPEDAQKSLDSREFKAEPCTAKQLSDSTYLHGLGAAVITPGQDGLADIRSALAAHASLLLDYDCRVIVIVDRNDFNDAALTAHIVQHNLPSSNLATTKAQADKFRGFQDPEGEAPQPNIRFFPTGHSWDRIANFLLFHPAGKAPSTTLQVYPEECFDSAELLLLRRAFEGCAEVRLEQMIEGRSGARVFRTHARIESGVPGSWNQPYFVKIGPRMEILREYVNYQEKVTPYIPFHLGPHLVADRCCLGAHNAIIVGDYVEQSETLKHCARDGRAAMAISCLFNRTLRGWYCGCVKDQRELMTMSGSRVPNRFPKAVRQTATAIGATLDNKHLVAQLRLCKDRPWYRGPIHGDLHSTNVRVRATDAIVIDFEAHRDGLILRDIARLEVSLLTDAFGGSPYEDPNDSNKCDGSGWLKDVLPLYQVNPTANDPKHHEDQTSPAHWFHVCVRQIRLHARQFELGPTQYAAALVLELLLKASRNDTLEKPFEVYRRGAACHLAEQLLNVVFPMVEKAQSA